MNANPTPFSLGSEDGEALWFFGSLATFKATAEQTGGAFMLLEGELTFYLEDGKPIPASAGSFVHIPKGVAHAFQVDSETARILNLSTPQHERFYRAAGEPAQGRTLPPEGSIDMEKVASAAQGYGVKLLGPPPGQA
jgi:uncharacterized cupin superfamily protein